MRRLEKSILLKEGIRKHVGSLSGICILVFMTVLSLSTVLAVWTNGNSYIEGELDRAGFGSLTAWVSDVPDMDELVQEITDQDGIEDVQIQNLVFSDYEAGGVESDSEGQLILWKPGEDRYRFLTDDMDGYSDAPDRISPGEVYVSPSMVTVLDLKVGDTVTFPVARNGKSIQLKVAGYYEDPFMGSSMIGMKGFLICEQDYDRITGTAEEEGMDALAREGAMLHIFVQDGAEMTPDQVNQMLNANTSLPDYTEDVHSVYTIRSFMTILQNAFCALMAAFALILLLVALVVLGHSISGIVEQEQKNLGILKTMGCTGRELIFVYTLQYMLAVCVGSIPGILGAVPFTKTVSRMTVTTTGLLIPAGLPALPCLGVFAGIIIILGLAAVLRLRKIMAVTPLDAIRGKRDKVSGRQKYRSAIRMKGLPFYLALRQVLSGRKRYISACLVAAFLVFFASLAGRMNDWLGPDGQGMMDAFNPADLDLGVQALGETGEEEMEKVVLSYTGITDSYALAMPSVSVNGTNYTANVITEPQRFHISRGETCMAADQVVLTETAASDLGVDIGDKVTIRGDAGRKDFTVSGIYHCANDMGANLGMSREGYLSIGQDDPRIWCHHYFLEDPSRKQAITQALESAYGGGVHVHENTWPGLFGIISAMHMLLVVMYVMIAVFVLIVTVMTGSKLLNAEQRDLAVYRSMGCSTGMLRCSFAFRFALVALAGAVIGTAGAAFLTDPLVSAVMRLAGISNFASHSAAGNMIVPGLAVTLLFFASAWLAAGKISRIDMDVLTAE